MRVKGATEKLQHFSLLVEQPAVCTLRIRFDILPIKNDGKRIHQVIGSLRKPRRQRQRERRETKGLMSRTIAVHVRYNSLYISLPSSTKQQREMTNSALSEERELRRLIF